VLALVGPAAPSQPTTHGRVAAPRLSRHAIHLDDGHRVQVAVAGRGVPLVVVHGFTAEGFLYAQTLSRLVASGFKVIAIDSAGHGGTAGLSARGGDLAGYAALLGRTVDHLGIERAVFAGHSLGGRIVTELVAREPRRGMAVLLLDAIVGDTWDTMVRAFRVAPGLMGVVGGVLAVDTFTTVPFLHDPVQARKLARLWVPGLLGNVRRPWTLAGAAISILRSGPTRWMLESLHDHHVPVFVLHGDRDVAVPLRTAQDAARRANGQLVVIHGASHSWLLKDPESLPGIVCDLLEDRLGRAVREALTAAGCSADEPTIDQIEGALYRRGAVVHELTPPLEYDLLDDVERQAPRYRWTISDTERPEVAAGRPRPVP
jgi:pimeloyl-ACP methyl ester carboxylesterase